MPLNVVPHVTLTQGDSVGQFLKMFGADSNGATVPLGETVGWASDNPVVCSPDSQSGPLGETVRVLPGVEGDATITAISGAVQATAVITVVAPPPPPPTQAFIEVVPGPVSRPARR